MNLRKFALVVAIMAVAWPIMFISAPISGVMAGAISVAFDHLLGSGYWQSIPIISLAPLVVVWLIYCVTIYLLMLLAYVHWIGFAETYRQIKAFVLPSKRKEVK